MVLVDLIEHYGMKVPPFSSETQREITKRFFMAGTSSNNPLDFAAQFFAISNVQEIIELALLDSNIDGLILDLPGFYLTLPPRIQDPAAFLNVVLESLNLGHQHQKPLIVITQHLTRPRTIDPLLKDLKEKNIPVFGDPLEFIPLLPKISEFEKN